MIRPVRLRNRTPTNYALGVSVLDDNGHPRLVYGGAVSGFVSLNTVWLDQGTTVVVFLTKTAPPRREPSQIKSRLCYWQRPKTHKRSRRCNEPGRSSTDCRQARSIGSFLRQMLIPTSVRRF